MPIGYQKEIDNNPQSQTSPLFQYYLQTYEKEDITLTSDAAINDTQINVSAGHGITIGDSLIIYTDSYYHQVRVTNVTTNLITIEAPLFLPFTVADTTIIRGSDQLNVDGSVTPVDFKFNIPGEDIVPIDISTALFIMSHAIAGDDGKFGGISALTNGVLIRKENNRIFNLGVYKQNQDFRFINAEIDYTDKAPAGINGTNIKVPLDSLGSFGQVIRMSYRLNDSVFIRVQDDLTGLTSFRASIIGSYTEGEI
jgi:hypothetical protein